MSATDTMIRSEIYHESALLPRGPLLIVALLAALGATAIYLLGLPALWRMSPAYGFLFAALGIIQIGSTIMVLARPTRRRILFAMDAALVVFLLWALERLAGIMPPPDPWIPVDSAIGFTDYICAGLEIVAVIGLAGAMLLRPRPQPSLVWRVLIGVAFTPLVLLVLLASILGIVASSDGFRGAGFPAGTVQPKDLPAGKISTVEYCRPAGVPLAMDIYMPLAKDTDSPAPIVLYAHGGGLWGDRKMVGLGASQANHKGALFSSLQQELNKEGFVVATIDYRLPPGTRWPAPIEDAKCAVRFLRAHAEDLGIDANRIGVWGSSSGGTLSLLLGLAGPQAGFDRGQYMDQSSAVQAVVDMFGLVDLNDFEDAEPIAQFLVRNAFSTSADVLKLASPITYVNQEAPPLLILHGTADPLVRPRQSDQLAQRLQDSGKPVTLIKVQGAEHDLTTPGQDPSPEELTGVIVDFFVKNLK